MKNLCSTIFLQALSLLYICLYMKEMKYPTSQEGFQFPSKDYTITSHVSLEFLGCTVDFLLLFLFFLLRC